MMVLVKVLDRVVGTIYFYGGNFLLGGKQMKN